MGPQRKNGWVAEAFACLASWRENRSEDYLPQRRKVASRGRQVRRIKVGAAKKKRLGGGGLCELGVPSTLLRARLAGEKIRS